MRLLNVLCKVLSFGKKKELSDFPKWTLAILGAVSFLIASYFGLMFAEVVPDFVKKTNQLSILNIRFFGIVLILGICAIAAWVSGCIAARCHTILFESWFK